jgi:putative methyltransferase (TIGR04325 family)
MNIWKKTNIKEIKISNINSDPFNNNIWKKKISTKIKLNIKNLKKRNSKYFLTNSPLPLIILGLSKKKISIADYGSGDQEVLFQLINNKIDDKKFKIDSIEVPEITRLLKRKIKKKKYKNIEVNFLDSFNHNKKYDFVHISDSLQYNLDWKNFLKKIIKKKPKFVILNNLTSGNFKTYITEQKFYDKKLPYIFFNENEVLNYFENYRICRYLFLNRIKDEYQKYPQKNFKKKERLGYPKTLILIKN